MSDVRLERDLTAEERFIWGECPVCHVPHGEQCEPGREGAHLGRLTRAPFKVKLVSVPGPPSQGAKDDE